MSNLSHALNRRADDLLDLLREATDGNLYGDQVVVAIRRARSAVIAAAVVVVKEDEERVVPF